MKMNRIQQRKIRNSNFEIRSSSFLPGWGLGVVLLVGAFAGQTGRAGLVAYWGFDDADLATAREDRGGKDGQLVGDVRRVAGRIGRALRLDGDGDYVRIPRDPVFDIDAAITVAAWVKPDHLDKAWATILAKGDSAWRIARDGTRDSLQFAANRDDAMWVVGGNKTINDGKWHHVVGVFDGTKACLYVDGQLDSSLLATTPFHTNEFDVCLGENAERTGRGWKGLIDDVLILDQALNAAEVKDLYEKGGAALVARELGVLRGVTSEAQRVLTQKGPKATVDFLARAIADCGLQMADSVRSGASESASGASDPRRTGAAEREAGSRGKSAIRHPPSAMVQSAIAGVSQQMVLGELYALLAKAQSAAGAAPAEILASYRRAAAASAWSREYVPALLWLFERVEARQYTEIVRASLKQVEAQAEEIPRLARRFEEGANWAAFEGFLSVACARVPDPADFADKIAQGLADRSAWSESFIQYCRNRPPLKPAYISARLRQGQESMGRQDFTQAAEVYRSTLAECNRPEDVALCQLGIGECLFYEGRCRAVIPQIDQFLDTPGTAARPEGRQLLLLKGRAHLQLGEIDLARQIFSRLASGPPADRFTAEAHFLVGYCYLRQKDLDRAGRTFTLVVTKYPESPFAAKARLGLKRLERMKP